MAHMCPLKPVCKDLFWAWGRASPLSILYVGVYGVKASIEFRAYEFGASIWSASRKLVTA